MASSCSMCSMAGGAEFFTQQSQPSDVIPCKKDFSGCMYNAQGDLVCNGSSSSVKSTTVPQKNLGGQTLPESYKKIKEHFLPGMNLGGLPSLSGSPIVD